MFLYDLERPERLVFYLEGHKAPFLAYFSINEKEKKPQIFYQNYGLTQEP